MLDFRQKLVQKRSIIFLRKL